MTPYIYVYALNKVSEWFLLRYLKKKDIHSEII